MLSGFVYMFGEHTVVLDKKEDDRMITVRRVLAAALVMMLFAGTAAASPLLTRENGTAWLGENNYLFVKDGAGVVKQLPSPIADIIGMDDTNLYCMTAGKRLYAVRLDGSSSSAVGTNPTEEQLAKYLAQPSYTLEEGTLALVQPDGSRSQIASNVLAAAENDAQVFYAVQDPDGKCRLYALPRLRDAMTLEPVVFEPVEVPAPEALFVSKEAAVLVHPDKTMTLVNLQGGASMQIPAAAADLAAAVYTNGKLFQYRLAGDHDWQLISAAGMELPGMPAATPVPVPTPQPVVSTAAPRANYVVVTQAPTVRPAARATATPVPEDNTIRKWDRGSRVKRMQQRLAELGYPVGKVDGVFGNNTETAVNLFQSAVGASEHSYMTERVQRQLFAYGAPVYDPYMQLVKGARGIRVRQMQEALQIRGYNPGKIDGKYGTNTINAVAAYQQALGMVLAPNEKPGEIASPWLLMNLFTNLPARPATQTNLNTKNPPPAPQTNPPVVTAPPAPPATQTDLNASPTNLGA